MSEISPFEIAKRAKSAELSTPPERFINALHAFDGRTYTVKPAIASDRYPMRKWVVTESVSGWDVGIHSLGTESTIQLGYPIKDRKHPHEVHIIIDENFTAPWATLDEYNVWQQLIDSTYTDTILSDKNQKLADTIVDAIQRKILKDKLKKRRVMQRALGTTAAVGIIGAGVFAGVTHYKSIQEEDAARALAEQQRVESFDAEWSGRDLTVDSIPADEFGEVVDMKLPSYIPTIEVRPISGSYTYEFGQPIQPGQVRLFRIEKDGCYNINTDIEEDTTISAASNESKDNVVIALIDDENVIRLCKNGLNETDIPIDIAIQINN